MYSEFMMHGQKNIKFVVSEVVLCRTGIFISVFGHVKLNFGKDNLLKSFFLSYLKTYVTLSMSEIR